MGLGTIIFWILIGGIAGALADRLIQGDRLGIVGNIVLGVVGAFIGGYIIQLFGINPFDNWVISLITAFVGAVLLLLVLKAVMGGVGSRRRAL